MLQNLSKLLCYDYSVLVVDDSQGNHGVDPDLYADSPTAPAVQPAGDYADSPTAMDVQRREADPLAFSANHWRNGPNYVVDGIGKLTHCNLCVSCTAAICIVGFVQCNDGV